MAFHQYFPVPQMRMLTLVRDRMGERKYEPSIGSPCLLGPPPCPIFIFLSVQGHHLYRFVLHKDRADHLPYHVVKQTQETRRSGGPSVGKKHLSASAEFRAPPKASFLHSGGGFCLSPWHTMKCWEHMLRVRWGLARLKMEQPL